MATRFLVLSCILLQSASMIASQKDQQGDLKKSRDDLANSGSIVVRSKSQELRKVIVAHSAGLTYFDSACGGGWIQSSHSRHSLAPWISYQSDCP